MLNNVYGSNQYYPTTNAYPPGYSTTSIPTYPSYLGAAQPTLINGRSVESEADIKAGEVPMDGSLAVFPKSDGSMIYVKSMNGNGTIDTKTYIPVHETVIEVTEEDKAPEVSNMDILNAISDIQNQLDSINQIVRKRPRNNNKQNQNKETVENERA